jgi:hypothetical protein
LRPASLIPLEMHAFLQGLVHSWVKGIIYMTSFAGFPIVSWSTATGRQDQWPGAIFTKHSQLWMAPGVSCEVIGVQFEDGWVITYQLSICQHFLS